MYSQVDEEGRNYALLSEISDHKKDGAALSLDDATIITQSGQKRLRITTKGWKLLCQWKDGTSTWVPLSDMKESYPIESAEYAVNNKIAEEPAFAWWANKVLRRRNRVIQKVKKYWKCTGSKCQRVSMRHCGLMKKRGQPSGAMRSQRK